MQNFVIYKRVLSNYINILLIGSCVLLTLYSCGFSYSNNLTNEPGLANPSQTSTISVSETQSQAEDKKTDHSDNIALVSSDADLIYLEPVNDLSNRSIYSLKNCKRNDDFDPSLDCNNLTDFTPGQNLYFISDSDIDHTNINSQLNDYKNFFDESNNASFTKTNYDDSNSNDNYLIKNDINYASAAGVLTGGLGGVFSLLPFLNTSIMTPIRITATLITTAAGFLLIKNITSSANQGLTYYFKDKNTVDAQSALEKAFNIDNQADNLTELEKSPKPNNTKMLPLFNEDNLFENQSESAYGYELLLLSDKDLEIITIPDIESEVDKKIEYDKDFSKCIEEYFPKCDASDDHPLKPAQHPRCQHPSLFPSALPSTTPINERCREVFSKATGISKFLLNEAVRSHNESKQAAFNRKQLVEQMQNGASAGTSFSSSGSGSAHEVSASMSTKEYCRMVANMDDKLFEDGEALSEYSDHRLKCQALLAHINDMKEHIKTHPVELANLENPYFYWYRSELIESFDSQIKSLALGKNTSSTHIKQLSLEELQDIIIFNLNLQDDLYAKEFLSTGINSDIQSIQQLRNHADHMVTLASRLVELQRNLDNRQVLNQIDAINSQEAISQVIIDIHHQIHNKQIIDKLYAPIELNDSGVTAVIQTQPELSEILEKKLLKEIKRYRHKQKLIDLLTQLRIEYFALLDGVKSDDLPQLTKDAAVMHPNIQAIKNTEISEQINPDLVAGIILEMDKVLMDKLQSSKNIFPKLIELIKRDAHYEKFILKNEFKYRSRNEKLSIPVDKSLGYSLNQFSSLLRCVNKNIKSCDVSLKMRIDFINHQPNSSELFKTHNVDLEAPYEILENSLKELIILIKQTNSGSVQSNPIKSIFSFR